MLPSEQEYALCFDRQNSEDKTVSSLTQTPALGFAFSKMLEPKADPKKGKKVKTTYLTLMIDLPVAFSHDRLDYTRAAYSGITLAIDGFDILGNLSNISYVLNSQGRTETYRNSLPRYVMFHAIFHLNRPPEKQ